jgi:hypothetical protein
MNALKEGAFYEGQSDYALTVKLEGMREVGARSRMCALSSAHTVRKK